MLWQADTDRALPSGSLPSVGADDPPQDHPEAYSFNDKPIKEPKEETSGWRGLVAKAFNPAQGPGQTLWKCCAWAAIWRIERQQLGDDVEQGRAFRLGMACAKVRRVSPAWLEPRVREGGLRSGRKVTRPR